ncbi:MAG: FlaA1/EpsC-like NDP-sugar epimerase, partial [Colwellia sp.]
MIIFYASIEALFCEDGMFKNKNVLITGGTGSFGNAVLRRFLNS